MIDITKILGILLIILLIIGGTLYALEKMKIKEDKLELCKQHGYDTIKYNKDNYIECSNYTDSEKIFKTGGLE